MSTPPNWTINSLLELIPDEWRGAPVAVATKHSDPLNVKRISLHTNRSGRRVVLIHSAEITPSESES